MQDAEQAPRTRLTLPRDRPTSVESAPWQVRSGYVVGRCSCSLCGPGLEQLLHRRFFLLVGRLHVPPDVVAGRVACQFHPYWTPFFSAALLSVVCLKT